MAVRLVVTFHAASGKGAELDRRLSQTVVPISAPKAKVLSAQPPTSYQLVQVGQRMELVLLELWKDQAALDAHAKLQAQRPPLPEGLRLGAGEREDYTYNRTR